MTPPPPRSYGQRLLGAAKRPARRLGAWGLLTLAAVLAAAPRPAFAQTIERLAVPIIETVVGTGVSGFSGDGGPAAEAQIGRTNFLDTDAAGNLYFIDFDAGRIRRVDADTGIITTVAGSGPTGSVTGDGNLATQASFGEPIDIQVDHSGNLYVSEQNHNRVRKVDAVTGIITTYAGTGVGGSGGDGGPATEAQINNAYGLDVDPQGNLYIAERYGHRIRKVDARTGIITTYAGTGAAGFSGDGGPATAAQISQPFGLESDSQGNLYIADYGNRRVRRVDASTGVITTYAGDGTAGSGGDGGLATAAQFRDLEGVVVDRWNNLYTVDYGTETVRKVDAATGIITRLAGTGTAGYNGDGIPAATAQINDAWDGAMDLYGNLYINDNNNYRIRLIRQVRVIPPNAAPVAVGELRDLELDVGESARVALGGLFRDETRTPLSYSASSSNPAAASARAAGAAVELEGLAAGLSTVTVTATDGGGLSAALSFRVTVGRVLSFAAAEASAPEGGVLRLRLRLSRQSDAPALFAWRAVADGDPLTADADAGDLAALEGTGAVPAGGTEAFIEVPVLDDGDIEPARERLVVELLAPAAGADHALGVASALAVVQEGVCDRSAEVRDALRGVRECWAPSVGDLAGRSYLDLRGRGIAALRERDLLGLPGLRVLHLHGNRLAELPEGLFAGLGSLERLRLDGNRLAELPAGLFGDLGRLSSLDLSGNRLRSPPAGLWEGAPSLSRLDLSGNRVESLPAGFFTGASGLAELNLSGNPGAPFTLTMNLARTDAEDFAPGPATVAARVREGAPFALSADLAVRGSAELSTETARIGAGEVSGAPIMVALTAGGAARLSPAGAPEVPAGLCGDVQDGRRPCFQGIRTAAGPGLLLFKRPPRLVRAVPGLEAESLGGAASLDLAEFFKADGGEELTWAAESSDASLASARVEGGVLRVLPNGEGLEGLVTVTITATDADGLAAEASFEVEVLPEARPFPRGWRLLWLTGGAPASGASGGLPPGAEPR